MSLHSPARRAFTRRTAAGAASLLWPALVPAGAAPAAPAPRSPGRAAGALLSGCRNGGDLWVGDHRGQLFQSRDGGACWSRAAESGAGGITAIAMAGSRGIAVGHRGTVLTSGDAGGRWQRRRIETQESLSLLDALLLPQDRLLAVGAFGACWASDDGGQRWAALKPIADDRHLNACAAGDDGVLIVVGERGLILRSADAGLSWSEASSGVGASLFAVVAAGGRQFIAAGLGGALLHSADAGEHWQPIASPSRAAWFGGSLIGGGAGRRVLLGGSGGALVSLAPEGSAGWSVAHAGRSGPGAWRTVLDAGTPAAPGTLLAVGENGLQPLPAGPWLPAPGQGAAS